MEIIYDNDIYKQYKNTHYYVNTEGHVYSDYAHRIIRGQLRSKRRQKKYLYIDVFNSSTGRQQHISVHRMVYETWVRDLTPDEQVNHKNDNSMDNRLCNLYVGTQSENIQDSIQNGNRVGNMFYLTVYDKDRNRTITFCPASDFIKYSGHTSKNGSITKMMRKNWFKEKYIVINYKRIRNKQDIISIRSVTTMGDECNPVG